MKYLSPSDQSYRRFAPCSVALLCLAFALSLISCNKVGQLVDRLTDSVGGQGDDNVTVTEMNEKEAKAFISKESKLVIVEFYTDT